MAEKREGRKRMALFFAFLKIGMFTIGGGYAMIPIMQRVIVDEKKWMNESEMTDCLAVSQALPGAIAINAATYVGRKKSGFLGSALSTLGVILPSFICITLIVLLLGKIGDNSYVEGALTGIRAAACGLITVVAYRMGRQLLSGPFQWAVALAVFAAIGIFRVTAIFGIIFSAAAGLVYIKYREKHSGGAK